jgi:spermidine synthase
VLAPGGVMTVNLLGRNSSFALGAARIAAVLGRDQLWRLTPTREGNTILDAARGVEVPDSETLTARADAIESRYKLPAHKRLRLVRPYRPA